MPDERVDLKSFEASFEELEALVRRLEAGTLTLDESLAHYERGVAALKQCYRILEQAEKRLELLVRDEEGGLSTRPADLAKLRGEARGEARVEGTREAACEGMREARAARGAEPSPREAPPRAAGGAAVVREPAPAMREAVDCRTGELVREPVAVEGGAGAALPAAVGGADGAGPGAAALAPVPAAAGGAAGGLASPARAGSKPPLPAPPGKRRESGERTLFESWSD